MTAMRGGETILDRCHAALDGITYLFHLVSLCILTALVLLVNADVAGRFFLNAPIAGVAEMMGQMVVAFVFLQGPRAFRYRLFLRNDTLLVSLARHRARSARVLSLALHATAALVLVVLLMRTVPMFADAWMQDDYVGAIGSFTVPVWPSRLALVLGTLVLLLQVVFCARHGEQFSRGGIGL